MNMPDGDRIMIFGGNSSGKAFTGLLAIKQLLVAGTHNKARLLIPDNKLDFYTKELEYFGLSIESKKEIGNSLMLTIVLGIRAGCQRAG